MEHSQIEAKTQEFIDALHTLEKGTIADADQLVALYADDAALANSALDHKNREMKGRDEILQFWVEYKETLGDVYSDFHHVNTASDCAGLFWTTKGQNSGGTEVNYHGATLLVFNEDGKIQFFRGYYDTRELVVKES